MKFKQTLLLVATFMVVSFSFAQGVSKKNLKTPVIVAESGIRNITISDNIDLLLLNSRDEDVKASVPPGDMDKLKISYSRGNLNISAKGYMPREERISVFVFVDELQSLTLKGNAFAASREVLDLGSLVVNIEDNARISLKSKGKVRVNAPDNYRRIEEERYHLVLSTE